MCLPYRTFREDVDSIALEEAKMIMRGLLTYKDTVRWMELARNWLVRNSRVGDVLRESK